MGDLINVEFSHPTHAISAYLTTEAEEQRLSALVERAATLPTEELITILRGVGIGVRSRILATICDRDGISPLVLLDLIEEHCLPGDSSSIRNLHPSKFPSFVERLNGLRAVSR
jgi:hypothetical protein